MPLDGAVMRTRSTPATPNSLSLLVRMPDGGILSPPAMADDLLIDVLARCGISVRTEEHTGGAVPCARFKRTWADRLPAPDPEEQALLSTGGVQDGTSRVLSHIVLTSDLDGLELELPWDSLVPQTYWVAG